MSDSPASPTFSQSLLSPDSSPEGQNCHKSPEGSPKSSSYLNDGPETSTPQNSPRYRVTETPSPTSSTSTVSTCLSTPKLEASKKKSFLPPIRLEDMEVSGLNCSSTAVASGSIKSETSTSTTASWKSYGLLKETRHKRRSSETQATDIPEKASKYQTECENGTSIPHDSSADSMTVTILVHVEK